jgi:hypothetical protein
MQAEDEFRIIERKCGGWLALTPADDPLQIGATGDTALEAVTRLEASVAACQSVLASEVKAQECS